MPLSSATVSAVVTTRLYVNFCAGCSSTSPVCNTFGYFDSCPITFQSTGRLLSTAAPHAFSLLQVAIYLTLSLLKYLAYNAGSLLIFFAQKISVIFGKLAMQLLFHVGSFVVDLTMELVEGCTMLSWHGVRGMPCAVITPLSHQEQQCLLQQVQPNPCPQFMWTLCFMCAMSGVYMHKWPGSHASLGPIHAKWCRSSWFSCKVTSGPACIPGLIWASTTAIPAILFQSTHCRLPAAQHNPNVTDQYVRAMPVAVSSCDCTLLPIAWHVTCMPSAT